MVNINATLPTAIAAPFHPPTEALHHDNLIKPVIPKTEVIASYTKLREDEKNPRFSAQARDILQDENEQSENRKSEEELVAERRRLNFFTKRAQKEVEHDSQDLQVVKDFKLAASAIQYKYHHAVTPIPEPSVEHAL